MSKILYNVSHKKRNMTAEVVLHRRKLGERQRVKEYSDGEILITAETIGMRINAMAEKIAQEYEGKDLVIVGVLKGALMVTADLKRALHKEGLKKTELSFIKAESYKKDTTQDILRITQDIDMDLSGKDVLIVDDIFDSGLTMEALYTHLQGKGAASVKSFALLRKRVEHKTTYRPDYIGFTIPDVWVEGYGMDSGQEGRGNPNIIVRKPVIAHV